MKREDERGRKRDVLLPRQAERDEGDPYRAQSVEQDADGVEPPGLEARDLIPQRVQDHVDRTVVVARSARIHELPDARREDRAEVRPLADPGIAQHLEVVVVDEVVMERLDERNNGDGGQNHQPPRLEALASVLSCLGLLLLEVGNGPSPQRRLRLKPAIVAQGQRKTRGANGGDHGNGKVVAGGCWNFALR